MGPPAGPFPRLATLPLAPSVNASPLAWRVSCFVSSTPARTCCKAAAGSGHSPAAGPCDPPRRETLWRRVDSPRAHSQVKLNTDESPSIATEYGIRSIPTVMIFKNGQKLDTVIGAVPKSTLVSTIDKYL